MNPLLPIVFILLFVIFVIAFVHLMNDKKSHDCECNKCNMKFKKDEA